MSLNLRVCVIDDEEHIRKVLIDAVNETDEMKVVGEAAHFREAVNMIRDTEPDAVFLDIKLMQGNAFQVIDSLIRQKIMVPAIILNTGYTEFEYAKKSLNDYGDYVIKILEKPFWKEWDILKDEIIDAILVYQERRHNTKTRIQLRTTQETLFFDSQDIVYFRIPAEGKGKGKLEMWTVEQKVNLNKSISSMLLELPRQFKRINRYTVVNTDYVLRYDHSDHVVYIKYQQEEIGLGVGQNYASSLLQI